MIGLTMDIFRFGKFAKGTAAITAFVYTFVFHLAFAGEVIAQEINEPAEIIELRGTPEQKMNQGLLKLKEIAARKQVKISQRMADESSTLDEILDFFGLSQLTLEDVTELQTLETLLAEQHTDALASFDQVEQYLIAKNLPEQILQRHRDTVSQYQAAYNEMQLKLQAVFQADNLPAQLEAVDALDGVMKKHKLKKSHQKTDPNNLPWGTPDASKTRKPAETAQELINLTGITPVPQRVMLASNVITPEMLDQPGGPVVEDLGETPDIQFTDAIRAKALELSEDPVEIYSWVRNNIEFIPSYGSIQGADYTLQNGKGNAFDTASLLIALLRAANIPARYAYGTVEIPAEKVMNWVGGVEVPEAAQQLLGQGGIPNVALVSGGKITHIKMEHVWVEVWADYFPSRGAKHVVGDSWIPLDASFKQYSYNKGLDFRSNVSFDAEGLADNVATNSTSDESSISGFPSEFVDQAFINYTSQLEQYIESQGEGLLAKDVLGGKVIDEMIYRQLPAGQPYQLVKRTNNFSVLPDSLRHKIRFTLQDASSSSFGFGSYSNVFTQEFSLPEIAGKSMSLSFAPLDDAANEVFLSFIPEAEIAANSVPSEFPGYLLRLKAQLALDGDAVIEGGSFSMGAETNNQMQIYSPTSGWKSTSASGVAGEYRAIGIDLAGYSPEHLTKIQTKTEELRQFLENGIPDESVNKHSLMGLLTQSNILSYFAMNDFMNDIQSRQQGIVEYRLPSYGYFLSSLTPIYVFGIPRGVETSGVTMDVPFLQSMSYSVNNAQQQWVDYNRSKGFRASYLENVVPELLLSTDESALEGVSAAKILHEAINQGQTIYTLTSANQSLLSAVQIDSDTRQDLLNALNAGKEVTIHERPVVIQGWSGFGYLVIDPETGAGGYLISGGANGGSIVDAILGFVGWLLGMIDGSLGHLSVDRIGRAMFSDYLRSAQRALRASFFLGIAALGVSVFSAFRSNGLTWNAVGAASVSILAFALTVFAVGAIAAVTGPIGGAILGGLIAVAINSLAARLTAALF